MSEFLSSPSTPVTRREFLSTGARLGAVLAAAPYIARGAATKSDPLNVALIGCGEQGSVLMNAALKIPDIRFKAVCDIWPYRRTYGERLLKNSVTIRNRMKTTGSCSPTIRSLTPSSLRRPTSRTPNIPSPRSRPASTSTVKS